MTGNDATGNVEPVWHTRREISSFTLGDAEAQNIVENASHTVASWVTKAHEPVQAVMLYMVLDGFVTVTSTTNRAKYHAWTRNPAASFCMWDPEDIGRQVTLRGRIEIMQDYQLLERFVDAYLTRFRGGRAAAPGPIGRRGCKVRCTRPSDDAAAREQGLEPRPREPHGS